MPTYAYRREDGTTFETRQRITEDALNECPETGQPVERIISGTPGVILDSDTTPKDRATPPNTSCCGPTCGL